MKVITLGPKGTFSHLMTLQEFPKASILFATSISDVLKILMEDDTISYAILPLSNTYSGKVEETEEGLREHPVEIVREQKMAIKQDLVGYGALSKAKKLYAHPHSFKQCANTLKTLCDHLLVETTFSNSEAAEIISQRKQPDEIALVSPLAAKIYSLPILCRNMQDHEENTTIFIILAKKNG